MTHVPVWANRLARIAGESFDFLRRSAQHLRKNVAVAAVPARDDPRQVTYRYGVRGELVPDDFTEDLRDLLGRARSVLDIAMTSTVEATGLLSEKQLRSSYFPISETEQAWKSAAGQAHIQALPQDKQRALRALQPFVTGESSAYWFAEIHNADKHRRPLELRVIPDPEFVMIFTHLNPPYGSNEYWLDWVDPLPAIENRVPFVTYRSAEPILDAGFEDIPLALAIWFDSEWRDVQHLLWDVMEFTTRACAILHDGDAAVADVMRTYFRAEREQLAAFKAMMTQATSRGSAIDKAAEAEWKKRVAETRAAAARFEKWHGSPPPGQGAAAHGGSAFRPNEG
ncbi:hypothetical protein AS029_07745 [Microbacterium enclense]|nr:hypothetical protein AS029_07745 [Microbacterium enclense]